MTTTASPAPFVHPAFLYRSDREYLDVLVPFVTEGIAQGDPVAVAVPGDRLVLLRGALGVLASQVHLVDMAQAGRNPGRIIAGVLHAFADGHPSKHVRIIGEPIWPGRSEVEYPACVQHETLINTAFADRDVTIVCPYDVTRLDSLVVSDAIDTHPLIWEGSGSRLNDGFAPQTVLDRYNLPFDGGADAARYTISAPSDLASARRFAAEQTEHLGLPAELTADLQLILTELAANSMQHAGPTCEVGISRDDEYLVCEVRDAGRWTDPLAGRRPAEPSLPGGRGLLMVNDLADLVRVHARVDGTTIRAYLRLPDICQPLADSA